METPQSTAQRAKPTGPNAQALKYDILTALLVMGTCGSAEQGRAALRLSLVMTARYNWRLGHFAVGQRELARMWGVTERTAKREIALLRSLGWIELAAPSGRGKVAQHRVNLQTILRASMPFWEAVGPDYAARMAGAPEPQSSAQQPSNVVPFAAVKAGPIEEDGSGWAQVAQRLQEQDPSIFRAWFAQLVPQDSTRETLTLAAPTRFVAQYIEAHYLRRIEATLAAEERQTRRIRIVVSQGEA